MSFENAKLFLQYRIHMLNLKSKKLPYTTETATQKFLPLARKISGITTNNSKAALDAFRKSALIVAKRYKLAPNEELSNLLNHKPREVLAKNTISRALAKSNYLQDVRSRIGEKKHLAKAKRLLMYAKYLEHAHPHYTTEKKLYNKYLYAYNKAKNLGKELTHRNNLSTSIHMAKMLVNSYKNDLQEKLLNGKLTKQNVKKIDSGVKSIQRAYRKYKHVPTNEELIKLNNKVYGEFPLRLGNNRKVNKAESRTGMSLNRHIRRVKRARGTNAKAVPAVTAIQRYFRGYSVRKVSHRVRFLEDLAHDGRFDYYVNVLGKLEYTVRTVLKSIAQGGADPVSAITSIIGVCHYSKNPAKRLSNVKNVRKNLPLLKKKTPREYLESLRSQFSFVSLEYSKMSPSEKKEYRDRLSEELSGRPCLENLLESLAKVLSKPEFVWKGKYSDPLLPGNERYLGRNGLMNTAVQTWALSKNRPSGWNNMNLNKRKQLFWNKVKGLPLYMVNRGDIVNGTPGNYNKKGNKFKNSNVAGYLEWA
jgi:hypothetical protein